jgi:ligand-binding sensor domain-containing protein
VRFDTPIGAHTAPDGTLWFAYRENILWFDGTDWHGANIGPSSFALSSTGQPWLAKASARITEGYDIITYTYGAHWLIDISGEEDPQYVIGYYWPHPFHDNMPTTSTLCDIYAGLNGEMWISSVEGLLRIQGGSISLIRMEDIPSCLSFRDLEVTRGGVVYVVLPDGISRLSGNQLIPLHDDAGLGSNSVSLLAVDHAGTLWIKTLSELQYFDGNTWSSIDPPNRFVDDMLIMSNGDLWLAHGWPGGISRWDGSTWQEFEPGGIPGLLDGDAEEVAAFGDAQVCFAMKPEGVSCFDGSAWTSIEFSEGMVVDRLYDMVIDALGDIYVIASDRGNEEAFLYRFDGVSWSSWEINHRASSLAVAPDGSVWLADRNVGVFNIRDGQWIEENLAEGASIKPILDLQIGPDGSIWVGSDHGAWRFNGNEWESFLPEGMLLSENVSKIAIGPDGTIWFGGLGLARFGPAQ